MLSLFVAGLVGVIGLIIIGLLALVFVPFLALIPVALVGVFLWVVTGIRWLAGLAWLIVMGAVSVLQTLWHALF